jgi:hypothetical protein
MFAPCLCKSNERASVMVNGCDIPINNVTFPHGKSTAVTYAYIWSDPLVDQRRCLIKIANCILDFDATSVPLDYSRPMGERAELAFVFAAED